jgi:CheY-like chemotaxis protein
MVSSLTDSQKCPRIPAVPTPTILIADDDPELIKLVKEDLEAKGYRVLTATNGQVAFNMTQKQKPHLVILDVAMPLSTGLKAFEKIRGTPETSGIPVIFLSGVPSADVYPAIAQGTRVAHLKKPFDMMDLHSLIQQLLPH